MTTLLTEHQRLRYKMKISRTGPKIACYLKRCELLPDFETIDF